MKYFANNTDKHRDTLSLSLGDEDSNTENSNQKRTNQTQNKDQKTITKTHILFTHSHTRTHSTKKYEKGVDTIEEMSNLPLICDITPLRGTCELEVTPQRMSQSHQRRISSLSISIRRKEATANPPIIFSLHSLSLFSSKQ